VRALCPWQAQKVPNDDRQFANPICPSPFHPAIEYYLSYPLVSSCQYKTGQPHRLMLRFGHRQEYPAAHPQFGLVPAETAIPSATMCLILPDRLSLCSNINDCRISSDGLAMAARAKRTFCALPPAQLANRQIRVGWKNSSRLRDSLSTDSRSSVPLMRRNHLFPAIRQFCRKLCLGRDPRRRANPWREAGAISFECAQNWLNAIQTRRSCHAGWSKRPVLY
jgi:hypothetical protein